MSSIQSSHVLNAPLLACSMDGMKAFRHILTRRESVFWFHQNPDLRMWGIKRVFHDAWEKALEARCDMVQVFDWNETQLATGYSTQDLTE